MIGLFMALAGRTGASGRAQGIVAVLIAVVAVIALCGLGAGVWKGLDWLNDREAVADHVTHQNAEKAKRQLEAERKAGAGHDARGAAITNETQAMEGKAHEAHRNRRSPLDAVAPELQ